MPEPEPKRIKTEPKQEIKEEEMNDDPDALVDVEYPEDEEFERSWYQQASTTQTEQVGIYVMTSRMTDDIEDIFLEFHYHLNI